VPGAQAARSAEDAVLTALVPCLDEAAGLPRIERELFPALDALDCDYEVLLIDDGSSDATPSLLKEMRSRRPNLRSIRHEKTLGIGGSLKTGIREARGEWLVFLDADLTFSPRDIKTLLLRQLETGADCVSGSPMLGGMPGVPFARRLPSLLLNTLYRGLLDRRFTAFTPMFRLYRVSDLRDLRIRSDGFEVSVEILARLLRAGKAVVEAPTPLSVRETGSSKLRRGQELLAHARLAWFLLVNR